MRPTCRAFLAFASLVALPVSFARAGDPPPTPPQDASTRKAEAYSVSGLDPEVTKAIEALFDAPEPVPAAQPMPTDVPVLGVLFRGGGGGGGGGGRGGPRWGPPPAPPRGDAPRPPERNDAKPVDPRRAQLETLIRKAVEDALAFRRAIGERHGRGLGGWMAAPVAPKPPKASKPPKPPQDGPRGPEGRARGDANVGGVIFVMGPDGRMLRYRLDGDAGVGGAGGPDGRGHAEAPQSAAATYRWDPSMGRFVVGRVAEVGGPPPHGGQAQGPPPPPPGDRLAAGPLERLRNEVRALRREVHALRKLIAEARDDDDDADDDEDGDDARGCACHDGEDDDSREHADRDDRGDRTDRGDRGRRGDRDRRDEPRPRRRHGRGPGPMDGPDDDRR